MEKVYSVTNNFRFIFYCFKSKLKIKLTVTKLYKHLVNT